MGDPSPPGSIGIEKVRDSTLVGVGMEGSGNVVAGRDVQIHGNVIHLGGITPEAVELLRRIVAIPTEVRAGPPATEDARTPPTELHRPIDELLGLFPEGGDDAPQRLEGGKVELSRVDLLLRKAVLRVEEANRVTLEALGAGTAAEAEGMDDGALGELLAGTDPPAALERLREAMRLLREACSLAPGNTAVLLHLVLVFGRLAPRDRAVPEERLMLRHVLDLLREARTPAERLHRAQARFLLGALGGEDDRALVAAAREEFAALGRAAWVRRCDEHLSAPSPRRVGARATPLPPPRRRSAVGWKGFAWGATAAAVLALFAAAADRDAERGQSGGELRPEVHDERTTEEFSPAGDWRVEIQDAVGSVMWLHLAAGGALEGSQQSGPVQVALAGRWSWDPERHELRLAATMSGGHFARVTYSIGGSDGIGFLAREEGGIPARFVRN